LVKEYDPNEMKLSTKRMVQDVISRIDIRDMIQVNSFFDTLAEMPCDVDENTFKFEAFSNGKYADYQHVPNDLNLLLKEIGCKEDMGPVLRAMCAVSIICHSNKLWQENIGIVKRIFDDPQSVLTHIYRHHVIKQMKRDYQQFMEKQRFDELVEIHTNPLLPDDVDSDGNLPELRCGWKRCGMVFDNRDRLLNHVTKFIGCNAMVHRFHVYCRTVLEPTPDMPLDEFSEKAMAMFPPKAKATLEAQKGVFKTYYTQFQPMFQQ